MSAIGYGSTLQINDGASSAFEDVDNLVDIDPPDEMWGDTQSKRLDLASQQLTYVKTLKDGGEFSFTYEFDSTAFARMEALKGADKSYKITPTGGSARTVPGFLTKNKMNQIQADGIITVTATVRVTGPAS
jgi:hypothetical protein